MKKILSAAAASLFTLFAVSSGFSAYAAADKDVSALGLKAVLKQTEFTYSGKFICPEYKLSGQSDWMDTDYATSNYKISYKFNVNAGTGKLVASGQGSYTGEQTLATFTIKPLDVSEIKDLSVNIGAAEYTGKPTLPYMEVYSGSRELKLSKDYTVSATEKNVDVGVVKGTVDLCGNYKGSYPIAFRIVHAPVNRFKAETSANGIILTWNKAECDEANIFRTDVETGKLEKIGSTKDNKFTDTAVKQLTKYKYSVQTVVNYNGKRYSSNSRSVSITSPLNAPELKAVIENGAVKLSWTSNPIAKGYLLYVDGTLHEDLRGTDTTYTVRNISDPKDHRFSVVAYAAVDGGLLMSGRSNTVAPGEKDFGKSEDTSVLRLAKKTSDRSFTVYNTQNEKTTVSSKITLSDNDIAILEKFARENFTENMNDYEKLAFTLNWINKNVDYAYYPDGWKKIGNSSYVEAVFVKHIGQCAQYNGAMVSMMRYLGYEADLILGWRGRWPGNYWQHLWGEMMIDGTKYVIEAGNYGKSGEWMYLLVPYGYAGGYILNHKNM